MKHIVKFIIKFWLIQIFIFGTAIAAITDYQQIFIPSDHNGQLKIAIRTFYQENKLFFLVVDPYTLNTEIILAEKFTTSGSNSHQLQETPYMKALMQYTQSPLLFPKFINQGITHAQQPVDGVFLTIDMCPSTRDFEQEFFQKLVDKASQKQQPIPVAIAMSGLWLLGHEAEFNWLIEQRKQHKLAITWINHSFSHVYYRDLPANKNFLLSPYSNTTQEILALEKLLLEKGEVPSVFFRFPGLVSDKKLLLTLREFGLIPLGSDAWLALSQAAKPGSIVLVHGNSNEPEGIELVMPLLDKPDMPLLPINQLVH